MLNNKYRVHEVAKDFNKNSKEITDILTKYATTPKNHMQPLGDRELSLIFEYLTQHNQVESIESIYADPQTLVEVNLPAQTITNRATGHSEHFDINAYKKACLLNGQDDIDYLLANRDKIEAFEKGRAKE